MTEENVLMKEVQSAGQSRALGLFLLKRYKDAFVAYDDLLKRDPDNVAFWLNGMISKLQYSSADVSFFDQMISRINILPAQGFLCLANILCSLHRKQDALVFVNKALEKDAEDIEAYILKAKLLKELERPDELYSLMQSVYPRFKKEERILCLMALYACFIGDGDQADYFLKKAYYG